MLTACRLLRDIVEQESSRALHLLPPLSLLVLEMAVKLSVMMMTALRQPPPALLHSGTDAKSAFLKKSYNPACPDDHSCPTCSHHSTKKCIVGGPFSAACEPTAKPLVVEMELCCLATSPGLGDNAQITCCMPLASHHLLVSCP